VGWVRAYLGEVGMVGSQALLSSCRFPGVLSMVPVWSLNK